MSPYFKYKDAIKKDFERIAQQSSLRSQEICQLIREVSGNPGNADNKARNRKLEVLFGLAEAARPAMHEVRLSFLAACGDREVSRRARAILNHRTQDERLKGLRCYDPETGLVTLDSAVVDLREGAES